MLGHYLLVFRKNLLRQKLIAALNILGLAIGLCVFILISLYVRDEYSWERQWDNADRIVRLINWSTDNPTPNVYNTAPAAAMPLLRDFFAEDIALSSRFLFTLDQKLVVDGEVIPQRGILFVDKDFIEIFQLRELEGSLEDTLRQPHRVALSRESARLFFGDAPALGRLVSLQDSSGNSVDYEVTAVFELPEGNTSLPASSFALMDPTATPSIGERYASWTGGVIGFHYFVLNETADLAALNRRLADFVDSHVPPGNTVVPDGKRLSAVLRYQFQPFTGRYFNPTTGERGGDQGKVLMFAGVGILVLLLGTTNFVILSVASSVARKHEVGIRKAAGATGSQLALQLVGESVLYTLLALVVALALVELCLPYFGTLTGKPLTLSYSDSDGLWLMLLTAVVGILGGLYPALILSNLRPLRALKSESNASMAGAAGTRAVLVGFQFTITIALIIAALVLYLQLAYTQGRDPGFDGRNTLALQVGNRDARNNRQALFNAIRALPGVEQITEATRTVNSLNGAHPFYTYARTVNDAREVSLRGIAVGYEFFDIYAMRMLAGRGYDAALDIPPDSEPAVAAQAAAAGAASKTIINMSAARELGFSSAEDAVGSVIQSKTIRQDTGLRYEPVDIIGVVADSQFLSLREAPGPQAWLLRPEQGFFFSVRFHPEAADSIRADLLALWQQIIGPGQPPIEFADQNMAAEFAPERNEGRLLLILALLSIFVSCLGLYGLVAFEAKCRVKEIGIRKAVGGDFSSIVVLFLWQFSKPVLLANLIAWPLAVWGMLSWLQRFPYRFDTLLLVPLCISAGLIALLIAWLTVGSTAAKAASAKPVLALRYE